MIVVKNLHNALGWLAAIAGVVVWGGTQAAPSTAPPLSLLTSVEGRCRWERYSTGERRAQAIATFPRECTGGRIAWHPEGTRALVTFDPSLRGGSTYYQPGMPPATVKPDPPPRDPRYRVYVVDVAVGQPRELPLPPHGTIHDLGYDRQGRAVALTQEQPASSGRPPTHLTFQGRRLPVPPGLEGLPVLVHAFRLGTDDRWQRVDTQVSGVGSDYARGVRALPAFRSLAWRTDQALTSSASGQAVTDAATQRRLRAFAPRQIPGDDGQWLRLAGTASPVYAWQVVAEFLLTTGGLAFQQGDRLYSPPSLTFTASDLVALQVSGSYLLITASETGVRPRLYDTRTGALLFSSDRARAAVFWPGPYL